MSTKVTITADNKTGAALVDIQKDLKKTAEEADKVKPAAQGAESSLAKMAALGAQIFALKEIIAKVNQSIDYLAQHGNQGAVELKESFTEFQNTLTELANHPIVTQGFTALAESIRGDVIPAVKEAGTATFDWLQNMQDWMARALATSREEYEMIVEMQRAAREGAEEARKAAEVEANAKRQTEQLEYDLMAVEHQRAVADQAAAVQEISNLEEIEQLREDTIKQLKEAAQAGTLDESGRQKGLAKLNQLEQRRQQLIRERAAEEKQLIREREAEEKRAFAEAQRLYQEEFDFEIQVERRRHAEYMKHKAEKIQALREVAQAEYEIEQEKIKRSQQAMGGAAGFQQAAAGLDPRAVREEFARQQEEAVRNREGFDQMSQRDQRRALKDARTTAFRNFNQGNVSQEGVAAAQSALLSGAADQAAAQGKASLETAQAVRQLAITYQQEVQKAAQIEQEMRALQQQVQAVSGQRAVNTRGRAGGRGAY